MAIKFGKSGPQSVPDNPLLNKKKKKKEEGFINADAPKKETPGVFTDVNTGKPSGITTPQGETFLGLRPEEVQQYQQRRTGVGMQALPSIQEAKLMEEQQARLQLIQQEAANVGNIPAAQGQLTNPDLQQALQTGAAGAIPGVVGGIATGALAGGLAGAAGIVGGPTALLTIPALATAGGIAGYLTATRSNLKSQASGVITGQQATLRKGESNLRALITDTNSHPENAFENLALFNDQLSRIDQAHANLNRDTSGAEGLNSWLGEDGTPQLAKFEDFNAITRDMLVNEMRNAMITPNPSKILITSDEINEGGEEE